jgi:plastocyanin
MHRQIAKQRVRVWAVLALSVAVGACLDEEPGGDGQGPATPAVEATEAPDAADEPAWAERIVIEDRRYDPGDFFVAPEREVRVVNLDNEAHTVTAFDGSFDVRVPPGGEATFVSPEPGAYPYACRFHPEMGAEFEVR